MNIPVALLAALEGAINQYLALDARTLERMAELDGKAIAIELRHLDIQLFVFPGSDGIQLLGHYEGEPDARLVGTPWALARMGLASDAAKTLFSGDVEIHGDTEVGQRFKRILDAMDIDWEEHLSRITGDVVAHQVGRGARAATEWGQRTFDSLARDTTEYLEEEAQLVVPRTRVDEFVNQVDELRSDADRLEARVTRLQQHLNTRDDRENT